MLVAVLVMELVLVCLIIVMTMPMVKMWISDIKFDKEMKKIRKELQKRD